MKQGKWILYVIVTVIIVSGISCVPLSKVKYFNDIDEITEPVSNPRMLKKIMPNDNLYIKVLSIDEQSNTLFNANQGNAGLQLLISYPVDEDGNINFQFVGNIQVKGLTVNEASAKIQSVISEYIPRSSVIVRFVENKVSLLGQVENEGVYTFTQDNINIYEAIALAGGITQHGDRKSIVLIRQQGDKILHHKIDLTNSKIAGKDVFYILPNDVIVVEPRKSLAWNYNNPTFTTLLTTLTTVIAVVALIFNATSN